jgi:hypothetical protein
MSNKSFDVSSYLEALERPAVTVDGVDYVGKILSLREWLPFEGRFKSITGETNPEEFFKLAESFLYKVFPKPRLIWKKDIVPVILESPALMEIVTRFLEIQATTLVPEKLRKKTSGQSPVEAQ